jgi:hypothetical protein
MYFSMSARRRADGPDHLPLPWTITLKASSYTLPIGGGVTLTTETNHNLDEYSGSVWTQVYDRGTGQRVGFCTTGTYCAHVVYPPENYAWMHEYVAIVSVPSATVPTWMLTDSLPVFVTVSGSGYTLTMTKSTGYVYAWANKDITGHGTLEIRNVTTWALLASCTTGIVCYTPASYGAYVALLVPWGISASSNTLVYN